MSVSQNGFVVSRYRIAVVREVIQLLDSIGGRYWVRTSDPCRVKAVLYR